MAKTVFNREDIDFTKEPMFFGADQNVQNADDISMIAPFWKKASDTSVEVGTQM